MIRIIKSSIIIIGYSYIKWVTLYKSGVNNIYRGGYREVDWITKFDQLDKEYTDKALDIIVTYDKHKNDMLDNIYTKAENLRYSINNLKHELKVDVSMYKVLSDHINKLFQVYREIEDEFENVVNEIKKFIYIIGPKIRDLQNNMLVITSKYIRSNKDYDMLYKKIDIFSKNLINIAVGLDIHCIEETSILKEIYKDFNILYKILDKKISGETDEEYELIESFKKSQEADCLKTFDYKEMIDLAEKYEYKLLKESGNYIIMQHEITKKIVPIPANELKYGLMLQIQKQIQINKIS